MEDRPDTDRLQFDIETNSLDAEALLRQQEEATLDVESREIGNLSVGGAVRDREQEMEDAYNEQKRKESARKFKDLHRRMHPQAYRRSMPWRAK